MWLPVKLQQEVASEQRLSPTGAEPQRNAPTPASDLCVFTPCWHAYLRVFALHAWHAVLPNALGAAQQATRTRAGEARAAGKSEGGNPERRCWSPEGRPSKATW